MRPLPGFFAEDGAFVAVTDRRPEDVTAIGERAVPWAPRTALRRYGRAEEVAHMTLSVCRPVASYLTGAVIPVDGGLMARNA
ncbi:short chain dehydrogenase [Mycobacteroides abscessus]|uniref:D-beta-hydroxybutyrate dehydrogenase n=5 Tax=Mycobacteroides abscessus TaxID=36809 RepID=A0A829HWK6_9MYCO|nr:SDR family oxidoreductase [Mycobacteroides abscessus]ESV60030.1 enoyl-(Acyl carrier) reductase family protein [Mycobacteroides abscessus MAB_082312_2258]ESV63322.1 enoyl-(Acyl carrier) reductase family protein [Mycobacteroides abscessus MAB_091912_2446]AGM28737.1 putative 3-oxoacyl-[acyl-carrier-protein] reductase [Mycobacteroides abscessus subsp. bolletii 50594]AIC72290.1 D-beta-hydroxybutyrate dehydrogenase [Mycobacteroides abscessus subsp. massiliense str. GO 06]AMU25899.1 D-beta-hydroxy